MSTPNSEDDDGFVSLLTEIQLPLLAYIRSLLPGDRNASDVAQQANATIWQKRRDFELGSDFRAWAFAVARFEVLNYRKQQIRDSRLVFSDTLEQTFTDEMAARSGQFEATREALQHCLAQLNPNERELVMTRYDSSTKLTDYASESNRSVGGLKVALYRLRSKLHDCVRRQLSLLEHGS